MSDSKLNPTRNNQSTEKALAIIEEDTGLHFDPLLAPLFVDMIKKEKNLG